MNMKMCENWVVAWLLSIGMQLSTTKYQVLSTGINYLSVRHKVQVQA